MDRTSRRFSELGLGPARYGDERWIQLLVDEPLLLNQPLCRCKHEVTVGPAPETWATWVTTNRGTS